MKNIMYNFTNEDHRVRLNNIRFIERSLKSVRKKHLITQYESGQYVWPGDTFGTPDEYIPKLQKLAEQGIDLIQTWSTVAAHYDENGNIIKNSQFGGDVMYRPYSKEEAKRFIEEVHKLGMKIIPYTSTNFYLRKDPRFKAQWASDQRYDLSSLAHCSALSPGWREQILRQYATLLDEYNFDGVYIDTGYQRITDFSEYMHYYDDEVRTAADEILAFEESRSHDGGMQDLLGLIYGECKKRGKILKLHKEGFDTVRADFKVYDYLWVGEACRNINQVREHSKDYDTYVVPDFNYNVENDNERVLNAIPFIQFPVMRDDTMGIGSKDAGVPDFELMVKWLKLYKNMTTYGTWGYVDIAIPNIIKPSSEETVVTAFINRDLYIVIANYSDTDDMVTVNKSFTRVTIDQDQGKVEGTITVPKKDLCILRLNTPKEWEIDKTSTVGFSEEALIG